VGIEQAVQCFDAVRQFMEVPFSASVKALKRFQVFRA
jgi:hypothetical protein